ncbi:MAG: 3-phosphoshikimate 1-carboxyvinyltransferase [Acidobacteriota bacterium]
MKLAPVRWLQGEVRVPGDKSISHRYAILGAMASGTTRVWNYSTSQDCRSTLECIRQLGAVVRHRDNVVEIECQGWKHLHKPETALDVGNSGTTIRLLSALLAGHPFSSTIQGDESINRRPMRRIIVPLSQMGAEIEARDQQYPPLTIKGTQLHPISYRLPIASAQVKSCVLLAGLTANGRTTVIEEIPSRDHTERALPFFGARFQRNGPALSVHGGIPLQATEVETPGDFSSAVYFILAGLLVPEGGLQVRNVGMNPSRTGLLKLLEESGASIERTNQRESHAEPVADLNVRFSPEIFERFPREISGEWIPNLIDEIPALAILGTRLARGITVKDAQELRKKESDRIHSIVSNLTSLGIQIEEFEDGFHIPPAQQIRGGRVKTYGDHRIAMSFALASLIAQGPVEMDDPQCCSVSFPDFFERLQSVSR